MKIQNKKIVGGGRFGGWVQFFFFFFFGGGGVRVDVKIELKFLENSKKNIWGGIPRGGGGGRVGGLG